LNDAAHRPQQAAATPQRGIGGISTYLAKADPSDPNKC
jgi:hypothetical protein